MEKEDAKQSNNAARTIRAVVGEADEEPCFILICCESISTTVAYDSYQTVLAPADLDYVCVVKP